MPGEFNIAITGDSILNKRVSVCQDERFLSLIKAIRGADLGYTQLETLIHDYEGPEIYPGAEAGWTWMRSPKYVVDELKWAGFHMVSTASNHSLDFSYGGLKSTWKALNEGGIVHAGTGNNLAEARAPAYLETANGRVALISMCSSFTGAAKAGEQRADMQGRPGLNPLRYHWKVLSLAGPSSIMVRPGFFTPRVFIWPPIESMRVIIQALPPLPTKMMWKAICAQLKKPNGRPTGL
jgi:hypothetical protein